MSGTITLTGTGQSISGSSTFNNLSKVVNIADTLTFAAGSTQTIAGALNFIGSDALCGRNWGSIEHHQNLHFEACYYQAIEFAIARKLARVEAGAQGPHKLARGYLPKSTFSLHYLAHPGLARAVADYLDYERLAVHENHTALAGHAPFRNAGEDDF